MAQTRGNNEGSIYQRKDGRWVGAVHVGYKGGQRLRKHYYGATRQEVAKKLTVALKAHQDGLPVVPERQTVKDFLASWLENAKPSLRDQTHSTYEIMLRLHAVPYLGHHRLARLSPQHLQDLYGQRLDAGLSVQSVRKLHAIVHRALKQALRWNLVARNVADLVTPPRNYHKEMKTLDIEQAKQLIGAARGGRLEALYVLALTTGLRQGELLALRWQDVDLGDGSLRVVGTLYRSSQGLLTIAEPKTAGSRRLVTLGSLAVDALARHKENQAAQRLLCDARWEEHGLVFTNELGRPMGASNLRRRSFEPLLKCAGLPRIRFHDLRHTAATLLLGEGVHPKIASERLGHSRVGITLDLYSHVTPTMQREAAAAVDTVLREN